MNYKLDFTGAEVNELLHKVADGGIGALTRPLTTTVSIGGIQAGTTYEAGTTFEQILRDMLAPEIRGVCYSFASSEEIEVIAVGATETELPVDFSTNGITLPFTTSDIQFEYFAYPRDFGPISSIIQNGSFEVKDAWELVGIVTKDSVEYYLYRTIDGQGDDESNYKFVPGGNE